MSQFLPASSPPAQMRRLIVLVDALYEEMVKCVFLADAPPLQLLSVTPEERQACPFDEIFAFDRTVSRLLEMQSEQYLAAAQVKTRAPEAALLAVLQVVEPAIRARLASGGAFKFRSALHVLACLDDGADGGLSAVFREYNWGRSEQRFGLEASSLLVLHLDLLAALQTLGIADRLATTEPPSAASLPGPISFEAFRRLVHD